MMTKGVLEIVSDPDPDFYSRLVLVEKSSGGRRPVIDLSPLNEFVQQTPFRMETPNSVLLTVRKNDFLASMDLKDAYFQIPVHLSSRKLLRFVSNDAVYQFKALCFGLSTAPQVFTRVFAAISSWAHARGIRLLRYLDDWLILSTSRTKTRQHVNQLLSLCRSLSIVINMEKSDLSPSRSVEYLGMIIDTVSARAFPTEARILKFFSLARKFLAQPSPLARRWQVLLGHMSLLEKLVPRARLRMRSLQWHLKSNWSSETDPSLLPVSRSRQVDRDISWWMARNYLFEGTPFGAPPPPPHRTPPILGRVSVGVGSPPPRSISVGTMVRPGDLTPHQHSGDESSVPGASDLPGRGHQPASNSNVRQLHGSSLRLQAGGDSFRLPLLVDRATSPLDGSPQRTPGSEIPSGTIERPRGSSQPLQPSTSGGMVPAPTGGEEDHPHLEIPDDRPIRNTPQCEASPVLLTDSRPSGRLRRRLPPPVESSRRISVPTVQSGRQGGGQSQRDPKSLHDSDRPPLAGEVLVRQPPPPADPTPPGTTTVGPPSAPTPLPSVPRRRPRPEPSRVETVKRLLRKSGLSKLTSRQLSLCVRESTARLYQSQWLSFCGWCRGRSITPINATIPVIVDFLIHVRKDKGFSVLALKGYRSTINSVFTLKGLDLANSKELSVLFRSFAKTCSPQDLRPPAWDVARVLQSLTNQPYEPIKEAEECFLAQKTLFLIALASAKRVGELHALSCCISHYTDWKEMSFSFVPGFVAKTQDQSSFDPRFENFSVPALPKSSSSPNGRLLCPVQAVKHYLDRTAQHCTQCERLFITTGRTKKEISKNTVHFWLHKVISLTH